MQVSKVMTLIMPKLSIAIGDNLLVYHKDNIVQVVSIIKFLIFIN